MNRHPIILGIIVLLICVGLSGCNGIGGNNELNRFVGKWKSNDIPTVMMFNSDRTCYIGAGRGTYKLEHDSLVVDLDQGVSVIYEYQFSNDNNTLTLTEMGAYKATFVYTRQ